MALTGGLAAALLATGGHTMQPMTGLGGPPQNASFPSPRPIRTQLRPRHMQRRPYSSSFTSSCNPGAKRPPSMSDWPLSTRTENHRVTERWDRRCRGIDLTITPRDLIVLNIKQFPSPSSPFSLPPSRKCESPQTYPHSPLASRRLATLSTNSCKPKPS